MAETTHPDDPLANGRRPSLRSYRGAKKEKQMSFTLFAASAGEGRPAQRSRGES
jgi:hypothetical protein